MTKKFIWKIGDGSMEFSDGRMQYFDFYKPAKSIEEILYFYYDLTIKVGRKKLALSAYDFPKVHHLKEFIEGMINHNTQHEGYLLEDYQDGGFVRKVRYHQSEYDDMFQIEHFFRLEKYCYEVKQASEDTPTFWTNYKLTIGRIGNRKNAQSCMAWHIETLSEEELRELATIASHFVQYSMEQTNIELVEELKRMEAEGEEVEYD